MNMIVVKTTKEEAQEKKPLNLRELRQLKMDLTAKKRGLEEEILAESLSKNFDCNRYQILRLQYVKTNQAIEETKNQITDKETEARLMNEYQSLLKDYELAKYNRMAAHMSGDCIREYNLNKDIEGIGRAMFETECKLREFCKRKFAKDEQK